MEIDFDGMDNKVIKVRTAIDNITGRLAEYDDKYLKIVRKNGDHVYIAVSDITFIAPVKYQPSHSEVV